MNIGRLIGRVLGGRKDTFVGYERPVSPPTQDIAGSLESLWTEFYKQNKILKELQAGHKTNRSDINVLDVKLGRIKDIL